ncbi:Oxidation resistance protein 1 like protein [Argiope bruennichi]|uniref:Oxidation resistance protein 1 n=1 Tax=Argiope bruennichi TaxID=94029 RepID=A0A8T0E9W0_ARGBR|nr:Oxidation resistance protein 1 like protein [Argiope bruennichi]
MSVDRLKLLKTLWGDSRKMSYPPACRERIGDGLQVFFLRVVDDKDGDQSQVVFCRMEPRLTSSRSEPQLNIRKEKKRHASRKLKKVLSLGEMEKINYSELELPLPDLLSPSEILQEEHIKELYTLLPARAVGFPWTRIYSTSTDGFLLKTLYRKMTDFDCPVILIMQDTENAIFGALLSEPLKQSDGFYGTGETFLFTFHPSFKVFKWTGANNFFINGRHDCFSIGVSEGHFGLWIDCDLYRGTSEQCQTFNNDTLASSRDFHIKTLEAWGFV